MKSKQRPIFITGRFRSGTSFMWQIFNQLDGFTAWYEPLHPQLLSAIEHVKPKEDHVGIEDYWAAYRNHPDFIKHYDIQFATQELYLEPKDEYPQLESYINHLIELSGDNTPVLQFNRADFRQTWLRAKFPTAIFIHIQRNPLHLYRSQRKHISDANKNDIFHWDAYELTPWCYSMYEQFPFLLDPEIDHAFYHFYCIYQLSRKMAQLNADVLIDLEKDVFQSDEYINKLMDILPLNQAQIEAVKSLSHVPKLYEFDTDWTDELVALMTAVDLKLSANGLLEYFAHRKLSAIKLFHADEWKVDDTKHQSITNLYQAVDDLNKEVIRISNENTYYQNEINLLKNQSDVLPNSSFEQELVIDTLTVAELLTLMNQCNSQMTEILSLNNRLRIQMEACRKEQAENINASENQNNKPD